VKALKYKDLWTVCSQLKIEGSQECNKRADDQETGVLTSGQDKV